MNIWKVTWFDGSRLREKVFESDIYNLASYATANGVNVYTIIKIEKVPE